MFEPVRVLDGHITEEGVDGGKPDITGGGAVAAFTLQVS